MSYKETPSIFRQMVERGVFSLEVAHLATARVTSRPMAGTGGLIDRQIQ